MPITALYAGELALLFVVLSWRVIGARQKVKISIGDGGEKLLLRRIRVHANFAEYVPMALILLGLAESMRVDGRILHLAGIVLVVGRLVHAFGVSQPKENFAMRIGGMVATFVVIIGLAILCILTSQTSLTANFGG